MGQNAITAHTRGNFVDYENDEVVKYCTNMCRELFTFLILKNKTDTVIMLTPPVQRIEIKNRSSDAIKNSSYYSCRGLSIFKELLLSYLMSAVYGYYEEYNDN